MDNKAVAINMIANGLAFIITIAISFFLTPYIVVTLGTEAYGYVSLINNLISYLSLASIAVNSMAGRFVSIHIFQRDMNGAKCYFNSVFITNIVLSFIIVLLLIPIIWKLEYVLNITNDLLMDVKVLLIFVLINFIISFMTTIFNIAIFVKNKLYLNSLRNVEMAMFQAALLVGLFCLFEPKIYYVGISVALSGCYGMLWNIYYTKKLLPQMNISKKYFDFKAVKELIASGIWNVVTKLSAILNDGLDLLICNLFINPLEMGILAISKTIPTIMYRIIGTLSSTFAPGFTKIYAEENNEDLKKSLNDSIKILGFFMSIIVAVFIALGEKFFSLWVPSQDPSKLHMLAVLSILTLIISGSTAGIYEIFMITNKLKINSIVVLGIGLLNVLIVLVLLKTTNLGIYAVAGVSSTTAILKNLLFTLPYAARCINQKWYVLYKAVIKNVLSVFLIVLVSFCIKTQISADNWGSFILLAGACTVLGTIMNMFIVLGRNDRLYLKKIIISRLKVNNMSS